MADAGNAGLGKLDEAAKEHEKDFVIDLGADRIIKWIGVYLFLALAVIIKIAEAVESNIICFPSNSSVTLDSQLISYASSYCWETSQQNASNCGSSTSTASIQMPRLLREFIQWFPYVLLLQAFAFALPWAYWHFRFGARVLGHLKFMQLLLDSIFTKLQSLKDPVFYSKLVPYDKKSKQFDGRRLFKSELEDEQQPSASLRAVAVANESATTEENLPLQGLTDSGAAETASPPCDDEDELKLTFFERLIVGEMTDRHLFSMLCYENFASLPHLPYILSVFKLTDSSEQKKEPESGYYFLDQGMLNLWSNKDNLQNILLISQYLRKHLFTALMALVMIILLITVAIFVYDDVITSESFACQLAYENLCVLCSIRRKRDIFAIFMCDLALTILIFLGSLLNWWLVRQSVDKVTCHYFDQLKETTSIAFRQIYGDDDDDEEDEEEKQASADIIKLLKLIWSQWRTLGPQGDAPQHD